MKISRFESSLHYFECVDRFSFSAVRVNDVLYFFAVERRRKKIFLWLDSNLAIKAEVVGLMGVKSKRTQTIMGGANYCDFRIRMKHENG